MQALNQDITPESMTCLLTLHIFTFVISIMRNRHAEGFAWMWWRAAAPHP